MVAVTEPEARSLAWIYAGLERHTPKGGLHKNNGQGEQESLTLFTG